MNIHEETLKIARNLIEKDPSLTDWIISKFPELKESEDERIRKELIAHFKTNSVSESWSGLNVKKVIAWLEKQGEQKPVVIPKFKVGQTIKKEGFNLGFTIVKIEDGFYCNDRGDYFPFTDQDDWVLVEQNLAWSEEDEDYYDAIISKLEVTQDDALLTDNQMKFLKSLKDRYTWKPSNEQMEGIECTIKTLRYQLNAGDNRLDSLYNDLKKLREK